MTTESAILRAYALLSQGAYDETERMLGSAQGALNTPSGADLFARLRFEQGREAEARQIWKRIHEAFPDFEPATKALYAFENPPPEPEDESPNRVLPIAAVLILLLGVGMMIFGLMRKPDVIIQDREIVLTNTIERIVKVPEISTVTSIVTKVSYVTNTIEVVKREIETKTLDHYITNVVEKIVYRDPLPTTNMTVAVASISNTSTRVTTAAIPQPTKRRPDRGEKSWIDNAIMGIYTKLGLMPKTRLPFPLATEEDE